MDRHQYPGPAQQPDRDQGFTLIELLIVIAILGILSTIVVLSVRGITDKGSTSACAADERTLRSAYELYSAKGTPAFTTGTFEDFLVTQGFLNGPSTKYDLASDGSITATSGGGCAPVSTPTNIVPTQAIRGQLAFTVGEWVPANATPPADLAALNALTLAVFPTSSWNGDSWVVLGNGAAATWNGSTWVHGMPTGVVQGGPGSFLPATMPAPLNLTALISTGFAPPSAFAPADYVELLDGAQVTWTGTAWQVWTGVP